MSRSTSPRKPTQTRTRTNTASTINPSTPIRHPSTSTSSHTRTTSTFTSYPPVHNDHLTDHDYLASSPHATPILSPTKAAAQSRLTHDLKQLTTWLESLFAPSAVPPRFLKWRDEVLSSKTGFDGGLIGGGAGAGGDALGTPIRAGSGANVGDGNGVLEALKALKQVNLAADYLDGLVEAARMEELEWRASEAGEVERQRRGGSVARTVLDQVLQRLDADGAHTLEELGVAAVMLGLNLDESGTELGGLVGCFMQRILDETKRRASVELQLEDLRSLEATVASKVKELNQREQKSLAVDGINDETRDQIHAQTGQFNRDTKQISLKIMEYEDRVRGLKRQMHDLRDTSTSMQQVLEVRHRINDRQARIKDLQQRMAAFHGLPPDLEASRGEVKRAISELEGLKSKRADLFERIGAV